MSSALGWRGVAGAKQELAAPGARLQSISRPCSSAPVPCSSSRAARARGVPCCSTSGSLPQPVAVDQTITLISASQQRRVSSAQRLGSWCLAGLTAVSLALAPGGSLLDCAPAQAAASTMMEVPMPSQQDAALRAEEARYDENLMTAELKSFMELLDRKGSSIKVEELEGPRIKLGFRRTPDGRVSLRSRQGTWFNVKADMQAPGFLLLRSEADGSMYFLPPDDAGQLLQVDLSDDAVVAQLFSSGAWFDVMDPLKVQARSGRPEPLQLSATEFRLTASLLDGAEEESEQ